MASPILVTKLFLPTLRRKLVSRPRLIEKLNEGLTRRLTLISAPAGFGKTTLVTEWLNNFQGTEKEKIKIAWLALDESDNDDVRFLSYFVSALNRIKGMRTQVGNEALSLFQSPQPPPIETILTSLINELATLQEKIVFILDDFHLIEKSSIHDALRFLLDNLPPQLHLVIVTREDPFLPLSRLRARGQLTELRAKDLRFTASESTEFLNRVMGLDLPTDDIVALERRIEGWIAGLQLVALSMQGSTDVSGFVKSFTGSHRLVLDYLIEEVLTRQPEYIQKFLLQTAILDQVTGSLCDAVTDQVDGQQTLKKLEHANLFIVPLDSEQNWYRYHHLFADLLRQRLKRTYPDQVENLHLRASAWYQEMGLLPDAIRHALNAKDSFRVADLAELAWPEWNIGQKTLTWLSWVRDLPEEIVRTRPVLCVAFAQALLNAGRVEAADARLWDAEQCLASVNSQVGAASKQMVVLDQRQFQRLPAILATTRAYHAQAVGNTSGTVKYVERALELFPEDDYYNRAAVTGLLGLAYWTDGDLEAAYQIFSEGMFQNIHDRIKGTFVLAEMQMTLGHLREAERTYQQGIKLATEFDPPNPIGTEDVYSGISCIHREQGKLEVAQLDLDAAKSLGEQVELPDWQHRWCIAQARLKESQGELTSALDLLEKAERLYVRTPVPDVHPIAAIKARVSVKQDRLPEALHWVNKHHLAFDDELSFMREFEHITLARVLITRYKKEADECSVREAISLLEKLLEAAEKAGRMGNVIEILVLQALAIDARGHDSYALTPLERALALAEPEGYFQVFIDESTPMARLLYKALSKEIAPNFVQRLLKAFPIDEPEKSTRSGPETGLIEPMSERELEILQLIAAGLSNQEISTRLYLSLNTVKAHTRNIYGKLGVNNRTQASARARILGIILDR